MNTQRFSYLFFLLTASVFSAVAHSQIAESDMPQSWTYSAEFDQTDPMVDSWWTLFEDPMLDSLIATGISNNYDILEAAHRIEIAGQALRQVQAAYYPQIGLSAGWTKQRTPGATANVPMDATNSSYFSLGLNMNWEIDVFGKITARSRGQKAAVEVSRAERTAAEVSVAAGIASAYMQLRTLQAEKAVMESNIATQKRVVEITEARHEAGLASKLDVTQARTTYYSTSASITSLETSIAQTVNSIAVLLGVFPDRIRDQLMQTAPMPDYHRLVAVGVPMQLLRRRPDVVAAEYTLAQNAAALGVAKKDFLPTLSLSGAIGTSAHKADDLFTDRSFSYQIAPTLTWTVFSGMSRSAAVASAREQMQAAIDAYNSTVLTAVQEVESAMAAYTGALRYIEILSQAVDQAKESFTLSMDLYKQGLTAFINVQDAQLSVIQYSNELVSARGQALASLISLYRALGGGF